MKEEVLIAGFGGQGILLMGQLLAEAAMQEELYATWFPSYGPEMRGGTANCTVVFSSEEIGSPIAAQYSVVIAMNQPSLERFAPRVRSGGVLLVNASMVPVPYEREGITVLYIPAAEIAHDLGQPKVGNVVMLGSLLGARPALPIGAVEAAIRTVIGRKHADAIDVNLSALCAGRDAALERLTNSAADAVAAH
ncbi:MAG: 2-oxoacid:acceptor oxidoreductase family protein [Phycisphaerae bacterium]|nr:2-oxoacid:acceptor oxidoreductase family protein [Phycisphaerae bacterium]